MVLHHLNQDLDRFLAVVLRVGVPVEVVGLVDEQEPAHRPVEDPLGLRRGLPDVLADQVVAHGVDQLALLKVAEPMQQVGHPQRHRGLPGAGGTGEAHMQVRPGRLEAEPVPRPVDQEERRDLLHLLLHRDQPDQVGVEGVQHLVDARGAALVGEGDRRVDGQGRCRPLPSRGPRGPGGAGALRRRYGPNVRVIGSLGRVPGSPEARERRHDYGGEGDGDKDRENSHGLS
jgi:hypothetical protein